MIGMKTTIACESSPRRAHTVTIRREAEPYSRTGYAFRAYYEDGSPMYIGSESLEDVVERVRSDNPSHTVVVPA